MTAYSYPDGLLDWGGSRSVGVRRLLHERLDRPAGPLLDTPLLRRLAGWARAIAADEPDAPRVVLLAGGPGNGKTEAIEYALFELEHASGCLGFVRTQLADVFNPAAGVPVPREATLSIPKPGRARLELRIVPDASVGGQNGTTAAGRLLQDMAERVNASPNQFYLACVNRGILDDALILAIEQGQESGRRLLEGVVQAAATGPLSPECWPLQGFPHVAVWPMDVESLLAADHRDSPAQQLLALATDGERWPGLHTCPSGTDCPFCTSRQQLSDTDAIRALLRLLRAYELAAGKRWSFRELFTLISLLLAGPAPADGKEAHSPCSWAVRELSLANGRSKATKRGLMAPYAVACSQYQQLLFSSWVRPDRTEWTSALRELDLRHESDIRGLMHFVSTPRHLALPVPLAAHLRALDCLLDPALADGSSSAPLRGRAPLSMREIDLRFSQGVEDGLAFLTPLGLLTHLDLGLLKRLAACDNELSALATKPSAAAKASYLQRYIRDFACRYAKRSVGTLLGLFKDQVWIDLFSQLLDGAPALLGETAKQVEGLLNEDGAFAVSLTTTFGEPLPPRPRRVILTASRQRVRKHQPTARTRPTGDLRYLQVAGQFIPLTFDLFKAVGMLRNGMHPASLPKTVVALIDTTRARLAGHVVRNADELDGAVIRVGLGTELISHDGVRFLVSKEARP
jgi:hypothetical protein